MLIVCIRPTSIGEFGIYQGVTKVMLNIVEKYSAETAVESEDGVVAIEYVVVAGAIVVALAALWTAFGTQLATKLQEIVTGI